MSLDGYTDAGDILVAQDPEGRNVRVRATQSGAVIAVVEEPEVPPNAFSVTVDGVAGTPSTASKSAGASRAEDERKAEIGMDDMYRAYDADPSSWTLDSGSPDYSDAIICTVRNDQTDILWTARRQPCTGIKFDATVPAESRMTIYWYERDDSGAITGPSGGPITPTVVADATHKLVKDNSLNLSPKTDSNKMFNNRTGNELPQFYRLAVVFETGPTDPGGGPKTWKIAKLRSTAETPTV